jgi:hypothetical protein
MRRLAKNHTKSAERTEKNMKKKKYNHFKLTIQGVQVESLSGSQKIYRRISAIFNNRQGYRRQFGRTMRGSAETSTILPRALEQTK